MMEQRMDPTSDGTSDRIGRLTTAIKASSLHDSPHSIAIDENHLRNAIGARDTRKDTVLKLLRALAEATGVPDDKRNAIHAAISELEGEERILHHVQRGLMEAGLRQRPGTHREHESEAST
jgi:hypothetical protein